MTPTKSEKHDHHDHDHEHHHHHDHEHGHHHESPFPDNPVPEPDPKTTPTPTGAARLLAGAQFNKTAEASKFTVTISNPLKYAYVGMPPVGTVLGPVDDKGQPKYTGDDCVISVQPDGSIQVRAKGSAGAWEVCTKQNGLAVWHPDPATAFGIPYAD